MKNLSKVMDQLKETGWCCLEDVRKNLQIDRCLLMEIIESLEKIGRIKVDKDRDKAKITNLGSCFKKLEKRNR